MMNIELLKNLDFGSVDSESENELDKKFLKTNDFEKFLIPKNSLVLGAKGSGKSALFEMFSKYEDETRQISSGALDDVLLVTGTGFKDLKELTTDDMKKLMQEDNFDFDEVWKLYIAIKVALKLGQEGYCSGEILCEFLKKTGQITDYRILPLLRSMWKVIIGTPPAGIDIDYKGIKIKLAKGKNVDTQDLLDEINELLGQEGKCCWILFDKIDELFATNFEKRKECIESLFSVYLQFVHTYPNIKLKIFLRTDIWNTLNFVNKSHIADKIIQIEWNNIDLIALMIKRICIDENIKKYIENKVNMNYESILSNTQSLTEAFYTIFDTQVYKGRREAKVIDWIISHIMDGLNGIYPREIINFGNEAKFIQLNNGLDDFTEHLISGTSIKMAYYEVSKKKCTTYLSEFPDLQRHFERFNGCTKSKLTRLEIKKMMRGLSPKGDIMIKRLYEVGILLPIKGIGFNANEFEVPRLFRSGLGMVIKGRP